jgi:dipeptidyl-peptidase-3
VISNLGRLQHRLDESNDGNIDYINSFIEVYNDPLGYRGSYESIVQIKDFDMSAKMEVC